MTAPWLLLEQWLRDAQGAGIREPEAMTLATATARGAPSARIVLCRGIGEDGVRFFTNYQSRKAGELEENPLSALVFYWEPLHRQARIEGTVLRLSGEDSDAYFAGRPRGSQLGAWASPQSRPIGSLDEVHLKVQQLDREHEGRAVPRPPFWGGYLVVPSRYEFWTAGDARLHDRRVFTRRGTDWHEERLGP